MMIKVTGMTLKDTFYRTHRFNLWIVWCCFGLRWKLL